MDVVRQHNPLVGKNQQGQQTGGPGPTSGPAGPSLVLGSASDRQRCVIIDGSRSET